MTPSTIQRPNKFDIAARVRTSVPTYPWQLAPLSVHLPTTGIKPTRREFLIGAAGLLLLPAGCGSSEEAGPDETTSSGTRTIKHKYGRTEIKGRPERVVTVGYSDHDAVLALGLTPVGVRDWFGDQPQATWPWAQDKLGDAKLEVLPAQELNFEQIATLEPDLILGVYSGLTKKEFKTLSEIAPTVAQSSEYADYGTPWQEQTRIIGRALGREERSEELVGAVERRFAEMREDHPEFESATGVAAYSFAPEEYGAYGPQDPRARFLTSLGFELPPKIIDLAGDEFFTTISEERLDLLDADVLVWIVNSPAEQKTIEKNPLYPKLDVVSEGRDLFLEANDPLAGALSFSTVLSLPFALDRLVPKLAAAIDGDSDTEMSSAS